MTPKVSKNKPEVKMGLLSSFKGLSTTSRLGAIFSGGGNQMIGEAMGTNAQNEIAERNLRFQKQNWNWQKQVQEKTWEREDNATQRRKADLIAAGLSPVLAAGDAAGAGAIVHTDAPQREMTKQTNLFEAAGLAMSLMSAKAAISKTFAENALIQKQQILTDANTARANMSTATEAYNLQKAKEAGTSTQPSIPGRIYKDAVNVFKSKIEPYVDKAIKIPDKKGQISPKMKEAWKRYYSK